MASSTYHVASFQPLRQAKEELAAGDVRQASAKGWDAATQIAKAVAAQRGWEHRGHAQLFDAVATIAAETGDEDIDRLLELASALHTNFYEDWYGAGRVERGIRDIETFFDNLQPSING